MKPGIAASGEASVGDLRAELAAWITADAGAGCVGAIDMGIATVGDGTCAAGCTAGATGAGTVRGEMLRRSCAAAAAADAAVLMLRAGGTTAWAFLRVRSGAGSGLSSVAARAGMPRRPRSSLSSARSDAFSATSCRSRCVAVATNSIAFSTIAFLDARLTCDR